MKQVKIYIRPDGLVQAETLGIKGKACTDYIKVLEELLDAEAVESSYTPEYYEAERLTVATESVSQTAEQVRMKPGWRLLRLSPPPVPVSIACGGAGIAGLPLGARVSHPLSRLCGAVDMELRRRRRD